MEKETKENLIKEIDKLFSQLKQTGKLPKDISDKWELYKKLEKQQPQKGDEGEKTK